MKAKVFFFLFALTLLMACGGSDGEPIQEEPEKQVSTHYSSIQLARYDKAYFKQLVNKEGELIGIIMLLSDGNITVNITIDPNEFTFISPQGTITDAIVSNLSDSWRMKSIHYGRYAFRGGKIVVNYIDYEYISVYLTFGPIIDDKGYIDNVEITCKCQYESFL